MTMPKQYGGLGLFQMRARNEALLAKLCACKKGGPIFNKGLKWVVTKLGLRAIGVLLSRIEGKHLIA